MAGTYRLQPDGAALVETPAGPIRMAVDEAQLQELGYTPEPLPPELSMVGPGSGAVAGPGAGAVAPIAPLGVEQIPGLGDALSGRLPQTPAEVAGSQRVSEGITNSPEALAALRGGAPVLTTTKDFREAEEKRAGASKAKTLRGGAEVREIDTGDGGGAQSGGAGGGGGGVFVPGGDIRAGYTRQVGVGQELIDQTEESLADASIDRKLAAQNIAERETQRAEQTSAAMGRQIRREEQAIIDQERRDRAIEADYASRQSAIDKERKAIEDLEIKPDTLFDREDWAKVIGGIIAIIGEGAHGLAGSSGPSPVDRLQQASDRSLQRQVQRRDMRKQNLAARETELERIEKHYGDPRLAAAELRDRQRSLIQAYGQKMLTDAGATDALDKFRGQLAAWDEERALGRVERQQGLGDKVVEQYQYQPARFVGGAPKAKEQDIHQLSADEERAGVGETISGLSDLEDMAASLPESGAPTAETRNILSRGVRGALDTIGGLGTAADVLDTPAERASTAKLERFKGLLRKKLSGAAVNDKEQEKLDRQVDEVNTREGALRLIADQRRALEARRAGIRAGFKPEVVDTYEGRRRGYMPGRRPSSMRGE